MAISEFEKVRIVRQRGQAESRAFMVERGFDPRVIAAYDDLCEANEKALWLPDINERIKAQKDAEDKYQATYKAFVENP